MDLQTETLRAFRAIATLTLVIVLILYGTYVAVAVTEVSLALKVEIWIRRALGGQRAAIAGSVVRRYAKATTVGCLVGTVLAFCRDCVVWLGQHY